MLPPEVRRLMPGCCGLDVGLLVGPAVSSREERRVRCNCWLIMLIEAWRGGEETKGLVSPEVGRFIARRDGDAPGWRLELRRGEPTWPNAEAPGREPDSKLLVDGCVLLHSDWKREGDPVATDGDPYRTSEGVGEAPSRDMDIGCEKSCSRYRPGRVRSVAFSPVA